MTRSNLYITLSNGETLICVAESSSAPEQGYIVESLILPLLLLNDAAEELALLREHCTMNVERVNATYRYEIDLQQKKVAFHDEEYSHRSDRFFIGRNLTDRYTTYVSTLTKREGVK